METFATLYASIPTSVQPASGRTIIERSKPEMVIDTVIYTPSAIALKAGDRVTSSGVKYLVSSWSDMAGRGQVFAIYAKRLDQ